MSRLLVTSDQTGPWYEELSVVSSYSESDYEDKIKQYSHEIFSEFYTVRFKLDVKSDASTKKPDLILIAKDYSDWWVVEVELAGHSIEHVLDQVDVFRTGDYNPVTITKYLTRVFQEELSDVPINNDKLERLIADSPPKILVIVDSPIPEWKERLDEMDVKLCDLQVFKNTERAEAYKIGGEYPAIYFDKAHLKFAKLARNTVEVIGGSMLSGLLAVDSEVIINYKGKSSRWTVDCVNGKVFLKCLGKVCPLHVGNNYIIRGDGADRLTIFDS